MRRRLLGPPLQRRQLLTDLYSQLTLALLAPLPYHFRLHHLIPKIVFSDTCKELRLEVPVLDLLLLFPRSYMVALRDVFLVREDLAISDLPEFYTGDCALDNTSPSLLCG